MLRKILCLSILIGTKVFCQNHQFRTSTVDWDHAPAQYKKVIIPEEFKNDPVVIVDDNTSFILSGNKYKTLQRTLLLKINDKAGIEAFKSVTLPESFDVADDAELWQQGRQVRNKIPFIYEYVINYFIARVIKPNGKVISLPLKNSVEKIRWIRSTGEFVDDFTNTFHFEDLEPGDLLEFSYGVDYRTEYGSNILYLSSKWSKMNCNFTFNYVALPEFKTHKFIFINNIPDSCVKRKMEGNKDGLDIRSEEIQLKNVMRTNYFVHAMPAKQLPQVYFNMYYQLISFNKSIYTVAHPPNFQWLLPVDTTKDETKFHTKLATGIRKFVGTIPVFENDSDNVKFFKAVCDTLNSFKYCDANDMMYNNPTIYNVFSTDHLQKRRISQLHMGNVYQGILDEKNIFYYITNIQDKRLGELSPYSRVNTAYESSIVSIPTKTSYIYFVPRINGLKYHLNELPFYYEGAMAALFPINFRKVDVALSSKYFKFIKTAYNTFNENTRIENCSVKVLTDSMKCNLSIKENLAGQFSTTIRPLYLKDYIDSTVNPVYFKKCTDKPFSSNSKIKLSSKLTEAPFRYVFNCSESIKLKKADEINLANWFSFVLNKTVIPEMPTHDFYFDFPFSDVYNFMFSFDKPVTITNSADLTRSISNDYFEISSSLNKQDENYILTVMAKVKKDMLPKAEAQKLMDFIQELDNINNFTIRYTK